MTDPRPGRRILATFPRLLVAVALAVTGALPATSPLAPVATAATPVNPKVVIVSGPVGPYNRLYRSDADALARVARRYTSNVVLIKTPHATWSAVRAAAQGASIFVYLGHGNGWPSRYRDYLWPFTQNGLGLDPTTGADGRAHVYYGEASVASQIRFAPNAVVLLFHLCYASGNTEPGLPTGSLGDKRARVDNYAAGFFAAGARAVFADAYRPNTTYMSRLFLGNASMSQIFHGVPTYHGHDIAWDAFRSTGAKAIMDPTNVARGPYYHSVVYDPALTSAMVTRTAYRRTDTIPTQLTVGGAATTHGPTDLFSDPALTTAAGSLDTGRRLRLLADVPPLADGTRVLQVRTFEGDLTGYVRADGLDPADGTPAKLYDYDPPGSLIGPNGDYVFDTFRVIVRASEPLDGTVTIRDASGAVVKTLTAGDAWSVFDWDLIGADGSVIPDGHYTWSYTGAEPSGNNPEPFTESGAFALDATAPRTSAGAAGTLHPSGWYTSATTFRLSGRDAFSGMRATYYRLDGGRKTLYRGPVVISRSGDHLVSYWSVDKAGNVEPTKTLEVKVDVTGPVTTPQLSGPVGEPGFFRDDVTVGLGATDAQSGVASTDIALDGAPLAPYTGPIVVSAAGPHRVSFRSTDVTGHREATKTITFTIDRTAPSLGDPAAVVPSATRFSPNGDGLADTVSISHALTEPGIVRLVVTPAAGGPAVRTITVAAAKAGPGRVSWDGRASTGAYVPDGHYVLTVTPLDRARNAGPSQAFDVAVFGSFVGLSEAPVRFFPQDGDAVAPRTIARFTLKSAAAVTLKVVAPSGTVVRTIAGDYPAGPMAIAWDGRNDAGAFVAQGAYRVLVTASAGGLSETHTATVRAAAFELRPSVTFAQRGHRMALTVVTSETLKATPRLIVRQPGRAAYSVRLIRVAPGTYRATWVVRSGGTGSMLLAVIGTDRAGGRNATSLRLRIR